MKHYFENFLDDRKTYVLAENFWSVTIGGMLVDEHIPIKKWLTTKDNKGDRFYDGDPIFSLIDENSLKALRVIQLKPNSNKPYIKAWVEKRLNQDDKEIDVLAISLELSEETKQIAIKLVENWFIRKNSIANFDKEFIQSVIYQVLSISDLKKLKKIKSYYFTWFEKQADKPSSNLTIQFTNKILNYFKKDANVVFSTEELNQTYLQIYSSILLKTLTDVYGIKGNAKNKSESEIASIIISNKPSKSIVSLFLKNYKAKIHSSTNSINNLIKDLEKEVI